MNARALTTARAASRQRRFASKQTRAIAVYAVLLVLCVPFVFPFWWMITSSFKSFSEIFAYPPTLLPTTFNLDNYRQVFELQPFVRQYWNSLYIATNDSSSDGIFVMTIFGFILDIIMNFE